MWSHMVAHQTEDMSFSSEEKKNMSLVKMQYIRRRRQWRRRIKQSGWKDGRVQGTSDRGGGEALNPEQVNAAADRHGLSAAFLSWLSAAFTSPKETAGASQQCGSGQVRLTLPEWRQVKAGERSSLSRRRGASAAVQSSRNR